MNIPFDKIFTGLKKEYLVKYILGSFAFGAALMLTDLHYGVDIYERPELEDNDAAEVDLEKLEKE